MFLPPACQSRRPRAETSVYRRATLRSGDGLQEKVSRARGLSLSLKLPPRNRRWREHASSPVIATDRGNWRGPGGRGGGAVSLGGGRGVRAAGAPRAAGA